MSCTHGKVVLCDLGDACLVALADQFAAIEDCLPAIDAASERLRIQLVEFRSADYVDRRISVVL